MPKIKLDDLEFNTEDLSEEGLSTLRSLQFLEVQLRKLKSEIDVYRTAERHYATAIKDEILKSRNK